MAEAYRKMVGETVGMGSEGFPTTPFDFLSNLSKQDLKQLMDSESISNIALIAAHFESDQMADIIAILPEEKQKQIILEIARFDNLPKDAVLKAANELSERLKTLYDPNKLVVKGGEYIANYLSYVDSSKEEKFLSYLEQQDPKVRDSLRQFYFSFDDIPLVQEKYLAEALQEFDTTSIAKSLINSKREVYDIILRSMPPKKSLIVSDEVGALTENIGSKEVLECRKMVLSGIKKTLKNFGIEPSELLKNSQKKSGAEGQGNASAA
jgi:flagellar motor switch protein FliG